MFGIYTMLSLIVEINIDYICKLVKHRFNCFRKLFIFNLNFKLIYFLFWTKQLVL